MDVMYIRGLSPHLFMKENKKITFLFGPLLILFLSICFFISCDRIKQKSKDAIHKTGETVGKGTSEFLDGVSKGVDQTFNCTIELSKLLGGKGLQFGKFKIENGKDETDNLLSVYLIFNNDIKDSVSAKVFDSNGNEYGRTGLVIEGKKGEAKYYDFIFDKRTDIERKSKFVIE